MATTLITLEDLQNFKQELLVEIQNLLLQNQTAPARKWLKSREVRKLLNLSAGTLANLRVNGTLPFTKVGGVMFYDFNDIKKMIEEHKENSQSVEKDHNQ